MREGNEEQTDSLRRSATHKRAKGCREKCEARRHGACNNARGKARRKKKAPKEQLLSDGK